MKELKIIKCKLTEQVINQLEDIEHTDTHELGEVIDMIKDIYEAIYYCTIIRSMDKNISTQPEEGANLNEFINIISNRAKELSKVASSEEKILLRNSIIDIGNSINI